MEIKKSDFVQSLDKGLKVITAFDAEHQQLTLTEVAKLVDLTRANTRRILLTLQYLGYVESDGKYFSLSPKVLCLGYSYLSGLPFNDLAKPYMEELAESVNESCSISVLDGNDIVYVARVQTSRIMTIALRVGTRLPVHATSMGRVLLTQYSNKELKDRFKEITLDKLTDNSVTTVSELIEKIEIARTEGYALVDQELEIGVRSIAVPIKDRSGKIIAALNVSGHAARVSNEEIVSKFLPQVQSTVSQIESALSKL